MRRQVGGQLPTVAQAGQRIRHRLLAAVGQHPGVLAHRQVQPDEDHEDRGGRERERELIGAVEMVRHQEHERRETGCRRQDDRRCRPSFDALTRVTPPRGEADEQRRERPADVPYASGDPGAGRSRLEIDGVGHGEDRKCWRDEVPDAGDLPAHDRHGHHEKDHEAEVSHGDRQVARDLGSAVRAGQGLLKDACRRRAAETEAGDERVDPQTSRGGRGSPAQQRDERKVRRRIRREPQDVALRREQQDEVERRREAPQRHRQRKQPPCRALRPPHPPACDAQHGGAEEGRGLRGLVEQLGSRRRERMEQERDGVEPHGRSDQPGEPGGPGHARCQRGGDFRYVSGRLEVAVDERSHASIVGTPSARPRHRTR